MTMKIRNMAKFLAEPEDNTPEVIKVGRVKEITKLSIPSIYRLAADETSTFPKPFKMSERASVWLEQEVLDYIDERIAQRVC